MKLLFQTLLCLLFVFSGCKNRIVELATKVTNDTEEDTDTPKDTNFEDIDIICQKGTTETNWATRCPSVGPACVEGIWEVPENENEVPLRFETEHFAFFWEDETDIELGDAQNAGVFLEEVWEGYFGYPIFFPTPYCYETTKYKVRVHFDNRYAVAGGGWGDNYIGMWLGPGAARDHWGLAHVLNYGVVFITGGSLSNDPNLAGWMRPSHANFMPHQLERFRQWPHFCSEMLFNMPHIYYGSTRNRYCNWQFFEFLKNKHCYTAVNDIWTGFVNTDHDDPFVILKSNMGWTVGDLNDFFAEWAMHNITWDYQNPDGSDHSEVFRNMYGNIADVSKPERRLRLVQLEAVDEDHLETGRFISPYMWAPQRWGYNVTRLYPEKGAKEVTVTFRGIVQEGADSGWRWGLVATDSDFKTSRYSSIKSESDSEITFCIDDREELFLVVLGAPTVYQPVYWDQPYHTIYRFPYMVELKGAWPQGFKDGKRDDCETGSRHPNGGGCVSIDIPESVYVGPYAKVMGGNVADGVRIEDHAVILGGNIEGGVVGGLTIMEDFTVQNDAIIQSSFYPIDHFGSGLVASGEARFYGDVEFVGNNVNKTSGGYTGFVDEATAGGDIEDINEFPDYTWRP